MNIALREEENLLLSIPHSFLEFLRFTSFKKKSASTINPRFRWDKAFFSQLKGDNIPNLNCVFVFSSVICVF